MTSAASAPLATVASTASLALRYYARLGLDATQLDPLPTLAKLQAIQEAHVTNIPFENLSQHGCSQPAVLNVEATAVKVLDTKRGGFCFELNGLLAQFLTELGYQVCRVSCFVNVEGVYRDVATHMVLIVTVPDEANGSSLWMVDVGFGEPPLQPLSYDVSSTWDQEQLTAEGMPSKLVRLVDDATGVEYVHLMWYRAEKEAWTPRLKWKYDDALLGANGPPLEAFAPGLEAVLMETSVFGQKVICCLVSRTVKRTLAGSRLKVTGPPRFQDVAPTNQDLQSIDEAREILERDFGIPMAQSQGLQLTKSKAADPAIWAQM